MIDREAFAQGMGQLGGAFGREIDGPVSKMYYGILSPKLSSAQWAAAVTQVVATERFWPSPAVILAAAQADGATESQRAFDVVNDALRQHGGYRFLSHDVAKRWDAATWVGISAVGGLVEITNCTDHRWESLQRKFRAAYESARIATPALRAGPEQPQAETRRLVASVAQHLPTMEMP